MGTHLHFGSGHRGYRHTASNTNTLGKKGTIFIGIIFLIIGVFCLWFYFNGTNDVKHADYVTTTGYVYDYDEYWDSSEGHYMYKIIVKYEVNDEEYFVKSNSSTNIPKRLDSYVEVKYNPDNPSESFISGKDDSSWIVLVVGIVFPLASVLLLYNGAKMPSEKKKIENSIKEDI